MTTAGYKRLGGETATSSLRHFIATCSGVLFCLPEQPDESLSSSGRKHGTNRGTGPSDGVNF